jgi:hypothetical protein
MGVIIIMKSFFRKISLGAITLFLLINGLVRNVTCMPAQEYIKSITYADWLNNTQDAENITYILQLFNQENARMFKAKSLWINASDQNMSDLYKTIDSIIAGTLEQPRDITFFRPPFIPYLVKWVIPQDAIYVTIGDLHGNIDALRQILNKMQNEYKLFAIYDKMLLNPNVKIIFLGDYMDRGENSLKVFTTAVLLSLKNPGQVLMLRGNHEDMASNLNAYNLDDEIAQKCNLPKDILKQTIVINSIIDELAKAYEFLPVGAFIGYCGQGQTKFNFHVHGCIDPRIDYKKFLEFDAHILSENGGIKLWELESKNIMPLEELADFYKDIIKDPSGLVGQFETELKNPDPASGFLWHDISLSSLKVFEKSSRGNFSSPTLDAYFISEFSKKFESDNVKISSITRAHQHNLSKEVITNFQLKNNLGVIPKATPSCTVIQGQPMNATLPKPKEAIDFENNFGIITIISASVKISPRTEIKFPSTFLITLCGKDGNHITSAFYDSALLEF